MRMKMSRAERKQATFLHHAIRDYGIPDFNANSANVRERAYSEDVYGVVSYAVTVGDNVVSIHYYYSDCLGRCAYVRLNGETLVRCEVACIGDMVPVVVPFARMVQYLK